MEQQSQEIGQADKTEGSLADQQASAQSEGESQQLYAVSANTKRQSKLISAIHQSTQLTAQRILIENVNLSKARKSTNVLDRQSGTTNQLKRKISGGIGTGKSDSLKTGYEHLSRYSIDQVKAIKGGITQRKLVTSSFNPFETGIVQRKPIPFKNDGGEGLDTDEPMDINNHVIALLGRNEIDSVKEIELYLDTMEDKESQYSGMNQAQAIAQGIRAMLINHKSAALTTNSEETTEIPSFGDEKMEIGDSTSNPFPRTFVFNPRAPFWPKVRNNYIPADYISHFTNDNSREKFSPEELRVIDETVAAFDLFRKEQYKLEIQISLVGRNILPETVPTAVKGIIGNISGPVTSARLIKHLRTYYKMKQQELIDGLFYRHPDVANKMDWSAAKIPNPFKEIPDFKNLGKVAFDSTAVAYTPSNIQPLSEAAGQSKIRFKKLTRTSAPTALKDQDKWAAKGIISDKNKPSQTLTMMHQIRGRFGGPQHRNNIFLGTAASNLSGEHSHVKEAEDRIAWVIASATKWSIKDFIVDYTVTPLFGTIAPHVQTKITAKLDDKGEKKNAEDWAKQATPKQYTTSWNIKVLNGDGEVGIYGENRTLNADD